VQKQELAGPGEVVLRWTGALSSTERCDKLLARRVARDEGAVQAGVPISFIAMFGGSCCSFKGLGARADRQESLCRRGRPWNCGERPVSGSA
jgi:hypothetical protein